MSALLEVLLTNAVSVALLAGLALAVTRYVRRPGIVHLIWFVILLRLFVPPILEWGVIPEAGLALGAVSEPPASPGPPNPASAPTRGALPLESDSQPLSAANPTLGWSLSEVVIAVWATISLTLLLVGWARIRSFERHLACAGEAPSELYEMVGRLAERMEISCPRIRIVDGFVSPLLWFRPGRLDLVLPSGLLAETSPSETEVLIAHEMAHVERHDHWTRVVELVASCLFWWHPLVPWVRARLRQAEERCCDNRVLCLLPDKRRDYAEALVKAAEFLSRADSRSPEFACGLGDASTLEERVKEIMKKKIPSEMKSHHKVILALGAALALALFPTWAEGRNPAGAGGAQKKEKVESRERDADQAQLRDIRRQAVELERALRQLRLKEMELEGERFQIESRAELAELERAIGELDGSGEEASRLQAERDFLVRRIELESRRLRLERATTEDSIALETSLQETMLGLEEAQVAEDRRHAQELKARVEDLKRSLARVHEETERQAAELHESMIQLEADRMRERADQLRKHGETVRADHLERQIELFQQGQDLNREKERAERRLRKLEMAAGIEEMERKAQALRQEGQHEAADRIEESLRHARLKLKAAPRQKER